MTVSRRAFLGGLAAGAGALASSDALARGHTEHTDFPGYPGRFGLLHDTTLCVGCRSCEAACNEVNDLPPAARIGDSKVFRTERRTTDTAFTVVNRYEVDGQEVFRKHQCMHCNEPSCVSVCLVSALRKTPEGPVVYDADACMGCRYCMTACPYYALAYEYSSTNPRVVRCTMCYSRILDGKLPGCAAACPNDAIRFGRRADLLELAHERIQKDPERYVHHVFGEHELGGTSWLVLAGTSLSNLGLADLENASHTPLPELTKGFLSIVPLVLTMWPGLLLGISAFTKRRQGVAEQEASARVAQAIATADAAAREKLTAAAEKAEGDKERAIAQAVKTALEERAAKEAGK